MKPSGGKIRVAAILFLGAVAFAILSIAALTVSRAQLASSAWPMFLHDLQHTGQSQYGTNLNQGVLKWQFPGGDEFESSPIIGSDGTIYIGCDDGNLLRDEPRWHREVDLPS